MAIAAILAAAGRAAAALGASGGAAAAGGSAVGAGAAATSAGATAAGAGAVGTGAVAAGTTSRALPSILGRVSGAVDAAGYKATDVITGAVKTARANPVVNEAFAPGSTGKPMAGLAGSAVRKTASEMGQAISHFGDDTALSKNDASSPRDIGYSPFGPARPVQGPPIGIPEDKEHRPASPTVIMQGDAPGTGAGAVPQSSGSGAPPTPVYSAPKVRGGSTQYAAPGSAVYSKPPAGPYVQGMGDPFARRPQFGANPFSGSSSSGPPQPPGRGANPFETPGANPFEHTPKVLGRTGPAEDRVPGPIPSKVYPRGGDVGNMRSVLGDAAEVMSRSRKRR